MLFLIDIITFEVKEFYLIGITILEIANLDNYDFFYKICLVGVETIYKKSL